MSPTSAGSSPSSPAASESLLRVVGTFGLAAAIVNITVGGGIFRLPANVAGALGPAAPIAYAAEQATKAAVLAAMSSAITAAAAGGSDIHMCVTPSPIPPHGPGVVIDGSATVQTNFLPQCRMGDTLLEPLGPPNKIVKGEMTVIVGG